MKEKIIYKMVKNYLELPEKLRKKVMADKSIKPEIKIFLHEYEKCIK